MSEIRWGICGTDWREIRPVIGKAIAYDWAHSLANAQRTDRREPIDIYVDNGDGTGWRFVERVEIGATR